MKENRYNNASKVLESHYVMFFTGDVKVLRLVTSGTWLSTHLNV